MYLSSAGILSARAAGVQFFSEDLVFWEFGGGARGRRMQDSITDRIFYDCDIVLLGTGVVGLHVYKYMKYLTIYCFDEQ